MVQFSFTNDELESTEKSLIFGSFVRCLRKRRSKAKDISDNNETEGGVLFKPKAWPGVAQAGRFIRSYSIDELQQLWTSIGALMLSNNAALARGQLRKRAMKHSELPVFVIVKTRHLCGWFVELSCQWCEV